MNDLIIIGAGAAGLSAAIYACRAGMSVVVLEQGIYGGQIINTPSIENYPGLPGVSGPDFAHALHRQAVSLGAEFIFETVQSASLGERIKIVRTGKGERLAKSVILAGGSTPRPLDCPGGDSFVGRGVSYCATCDGAFHKGKDVAVVGGGNVAVGDALLLSDLCRRVYLIHRSDNFRAEKHSLDILAKKSNVTILTHSTPAEILGEKTVEKLVVKNLQSGGLQTLEVSGVFVAIGWIPNTDAFGSEVTLDSRGYIVAGEDCKTNLPGVFAAGDIRTKEVRQLVTATADGAVAALAAKDYLTALPGEA